VETPPSFGNWEENKQMSTDRKACNVCLEAVPPLASEGEEGIEKILTKIGEIHAGVGLNGVNIPEIREESSKSDKGERLNDFEPRIEPRMLAWRVKERFGLECMINRVVVHLDAASQAEWFRETWEEYGVRQFVLVGGEDPNVEYPGPNVPEGNRLIRETLDDPALKVGNICIPSREDEASRMLAKLEAGADFFTTQIVYHAEEFTGLLDELAEAGSQLQMPEILLSLCPIRSERNIRFLHWLGVHISAELEAWIAGDGEGVAERASEHIQQTWQTVDDHLRQLPIDVPVGIALAPIGKIPNAMTVELGRRLQAVSTR